MRDVLRKHRLFFGVAALTLFLSFSINFFGAMDNNAFVQNFKDSEALITNQITCKGKVYAGQLLESKSGINPGSCVPSALRPYSSQYGLQGKIYTLGYQVISAVFPMPVRAYVVLMQLVTALLSAVCFALIALWARVKFGRFVAATLLVFTALSPMLAGFGRNLYWALPLMILPFVYALYAYRYAAGQKPRLMFWAILGLLFYLRFLCGYEYITALPIMVVAVVSYYLYLTGNPLKIFARETALVLAVAVIAFGAALGTHIFTLQKSAGSAGKAVAIIKSRALERTADSDKYLAYPILGLKTNLPDVYSVANSYLGLEGRTNSHSQFWSSIASFINYAAMPVFRIPLLLSQPFATFVQSLTAFIIFLAWLYKTRRSWWGKHDSREVEALFLAALIGLAGYGSWLVLARSHSLVHAHINGILMYLPFALFGYILTGLFFHSLYLNSARRLRK